MITFVGQLLLGESPSLNIAAEQWDTFVGDCTLIILFFILIGISSSLLCYTRSAHKMIIRTPADLFQPYTPLRWLIWMAFSAAVIAAVIITTIFLSRFGAWEGIFLTAGRTAVWVAGLIDSVSYLIILKYKALTPSKFRYRPLFWLNSTKKLI